MRQIGNHVWAQRRDFGAQLRPPYGTKRRTEAGALPRGFGGMPNRDYHFLSTHRIHKVQLLNTEVRATQQNPFYSAKNDVALRMIAKFMPENYFHMQFLSPLYFFAGFACVICKKYCDNLLKKLIFLKVQNSKLLVVSNTFFLARIS